MTWRNPWARSFWFFVGEYQKRLTADEYAENVAMHWRAPGTSALRVRAGARHACARLRKERDEARQRFPVPAWVHGAAAEGAAEAMADGTIERKFAASIVSWREMYEQVRAGCTCGSGAHPRHCKRHPGAFEAHCESMDQDVALATARRELRALEWLASHRLNTWRGSDDMCHAICDVNVERWRDTWSALAASLGMPETDDG